MSVVRTGFIACALVAATATMPAPVQAADFVSGNANNMCNGSLPSFEGALRKRPLAIANEGSAPAFVSCSAPNGYNAAENRDVVATFVNRGATTATVNCTMVDGLAAEHATLNPELPPPGYYPKSVDINPGAVGVMLWTPADEGVAAFTVYGNLNCSLPPGVEINLVGVDYYEPADLP